MGQYFKAVVERDDKVTVYGPRGFMKMTEHSWISNEFTDTVLKDISDNGPARIAWIGDYADHESFCPSGMDEKEYMERYGAAWDDAETVTGAIGQSKPVEYIRISFDDDCDIHFKPKDLMDYCLVNLTKGRYMSLGDYIGYDTAMRRVSLFPLSILTAVGNGEGGGDYFGSCMESVGSWAFDEIDLVRKDELPEGLEKEQDVQFCIHGSGTAYDMFERINWV